MRLFPSQVWSRLQARLWRSPTPQHLSYATGAGDPDLRASLAEYLRGTRGVVDLTLSCSYYTAICMAQLALKSEMEPGKVSTL